MATHSTHHHIRCNVCTPQLHFALVAAVAAQVALRWSCPVQVSQMAVVRQVEMVEQVGWVAAGLVEQEGQVGPDHSQAHLLMGGIQKDVMTKRGYILMNRNF